MTRINYQAEERYGASDHDRPLVVVRLFPETGRPLTANAILDTGAEHSVFSKIWASYLGITDVTAVSPENVIHLHTADKSEGAPSDLGYLHPVALEWLGLRITIPVAFVPAWDEGIDNLLGMKGFFEQLLIGFHHWRRTVYASLAPPAVEP